jgi:hypothetical protein
MAFTNEDLEQAKILDAEIKQLQSDIAILTKMSVPWDTDFPESNIASKLVFHYQESGKDLQLVEVLPTNDTVTSLQTVLATMKGSLETILAQKEQEFSEIGEEPIP